MHNKGHTSEAVVPEFLAPKGDGQTGSLLGCDGLVEELFDIPLRSLWHYTR